MSVRLLIAIKGDRLRALLGERAGEIEEERDFLEAREKARVTEEADARQQLGVEVVGFNPEDDIEDARREALGRARQLRTVAALIDDGAVYEVNLDDLAQLDLIDTIRATPLPHLRAPLAIRRRR